MGAYFITNDENALAPAIRRMEAKGLNRYDEYRLGDVCVLSFLKRFEKVALSESFAKSGVRSIFRAVTRLLPSKTSKRP